ncbi:MAG: hypothetical protein IT301_04380 [Dehalococcoidia bacterium]|nr:hypothetical protein [Dehalococcoidia bacterium]
MSLFEPYSHTRVHELRQEQLAAKARRRTELGLAQDAENPVSASIARSARALSVRLAHAHSHPALDS